MVSSKHEAMHRIFRALIFAELTELGLGNSPDPCIAAGDVPLATLSAITHANDASIAVRY
ncbi:hypothetical protein [Nocardia sp. NPDC046763]|uniref:hypothetical protein n=1 Tax=Nocardia sp. NPDC046763 TaxID=3155256 RepID=UPI0033D20FC4